MDDLGLILLEILIFTLKFHKLPVSRYLGICNVLDIWHIRAIPTYRVYRLDDSARLALLQHYVSQENTVLLRK